MRDAPRAAAGGVLVAVGDLVEDIVVWPDAPGRYATDNPSAVHRSRGGSAANVAAFACPLVPTRFIGCVGDDPAADVLTSDLARHGVDVRVQRRGRTGTVVVLVDAGGERTMYPDRAAGSQLTDVPGSGLESAAILHVPSYSFASEPAASAVLGLIARATQSGIPVSLDASATGLIETYGVDRYRDLVDSIRPAIFFANASEAALVDPAGPQFAATMTVVKNGASATIVTPPGGAPLTVPVAPVPPVRDSTGAGDAFAAGFLAAWLLGADPGAAARAGHERARAVLYSPGASVPSQVPRACPATDDQRPGSTIREEQAAHE